MSVYVKNNENNKNNSHSVLNFHSNKCFVSKYDIVTKPITSPQLLRTPRPCRQSCGNSSLFINSWEGISELGPRRYKETNQQCVLFAPDPTARLETHNVYPDIGTRGARSGMRRN
ncbi:hypothetical protein TNCV_993271 [Trichonephila clavipes]|nr:hypothetical protein TNCV_993271 [Trichonephila clavipes]